MSLRFRLVVAVVATVSLVIGAALAYDYARDRGQRTAAVLEDLGEDARSLRAARQLLPDAAAFAQYAQAFCTEINAEVSQHHQIFVLDAGGNMVFRSRRHSRAGVEQALRETNESAGIIRMPGHDLAQARVKDRDGAAIIVAESMDRTEAVLHRQLVHRLFTSAMASVVISGIILLIIRSSVLKPVERIINAAKAWAKRDFAAVADPHGPHYIRTLAGELNAMAGELAVHEQGREAQLQKARSIQRNFMPAAMPEMPGLRMVANYRPAEQVGGDLYDAFELPSGARAVTLIDVSGHGIGAALLTGLVKMSLRYRLTETPDPAKAMEAVNRDVMGAVSAGEFATSCVGIWDPDKHTWTYVAAGHPGGVHLSGGEARRLDSTGPLLGVLEGKWEAQVVFMAAGDRLFLYTDGIIEAAAPDHHIGMDGLENALKTTLDRGLDEQSSMVFEMLDEICTRTGTPAADDMTLVGLEVLHTAQQPAQPKPAGTAAAS